jgi:hypothetical protein
MLISETIKADSKRETPADQADHKHGQTEPKPPNTGNSSSKNHHAATAEDEHTDTN